MNSLLVKQPSTIHGTGMFTTQDIPAGRVFYDIPKRERSFGFVRNWAYIKGVWINDPDVLNYVNHSCNPNTRLDTGIPYTTRDPCLISLRSIRKAEEITVDYNRTEQAEDTGTRIKCNCSSSNCKRYFYIRK
jgi:SET domain-containing protein